MTTNRRWAAVVKVLLRQGTLVCTSEISFFQCCMLEISKNDSTKHLYGASDIITRVRISEVQTGPPCIYSPCLLLIQILCGVSLPQHSMHGVQVRTCHSQFSLILLLLLEVNTAFYDCSCVVSFTSGFS